jgi:hypothetical protein
MKFEQTVKYSKTEHKFKSEGLLYMDLDRDSLETLTELFTSLSEYKKYKVLSKSMPVVCALSAVLLAVVFLAVFLIIGLTQASRIHGPEPGVAANTTDATASITFVNNSNVNQNVFSMNNSTTSPFFDESTLGPTLGSVLNSTENATRRLLSEAIAIKSSDLSNRKLMIFPNKSQTAKGDQSENSQSGFPNEMKAALSFTGILLLVLVFLLILFECRKRQIMLQLRNFEFNTIGIVSSKLQSKIEIEPNHSRQKIFMCLKIFQVYDFQFVVRCTDRNDENSNLVERQSFSKENEHSYSTIERGNSVQEFLETAPEKYESAILALNKKLDRINIKGM